MISEMGEVSIDNQDNIRAAEKAYNELSDEAKEAVTKSDVLLSAVKELGELKKAEAQSILSQMRCDEDKINACSFYYPSAWKFYSNGYWAADVRCFILPYIGVQNDTPWLRLVYNYTGSDWVFFTGVIVVADGTRFTKIFNYHDIVRDNDGGSVWEYMDDNPSESDIEMLWAIANSEETIVRFQGDEYYQDFTVSESDKESIRQALLAYEGLLG